MVKQAFADSERGEPNSTCHAVKNSLSYCLGELGELGGLGEVDALRFSSAK